MFVRTHRVVFATLLAGAAALALAVPARAADPRVPYPLSSGTLLGYCEGFDVGMNVTRSNQYIIRQSTVGGTTTQQIAGNAMVTLTNNSNEKSVSYNISGPGTVTFGDWGFTLDLAGPNLLWTLPEKSYAGVPTISYTTGHVTVSVDASGVTTSYSLAKGARQIDVCAVLT